MTATERTHMTPSRDTPSQSLELAACPFCGGKAELAGEEFTRRYVCCTQCDTCTSYRADAAAAAAHWNTRHLAARPVVGGEAAQVYLRDVGDSENECWVPCAKGDPGAQLFTNVWSSEEIEEADREADELHAALSAPPTPDDAGDFRAPQWLPKAAQGLYFKHDWCPQCHRGWDFAPPAPTPDDGPVRALKEMTEQIEHVAPNEEVGTFDGSGQWIALATVSEIRKWSDRLAASSTSAGEPGHG